MLNNVIIKVTINEKRNEMKYKVTDMFSSYREVQTGTCELCFSTSYEDMGELVLEDENNQEVTIPITVSSYGDYESLHIDNVVNFSAWLQEQDIPEIMGDRNERFERMNQLIETYNQPTISSNIINALEQNFKTSKVTDRAVEFQYGPNKTEQTFQIENGYAKLIIPKPNDKFNTIDFIFATSNDLDEALPEINFEYSSTAFPRINVIRDAYEITLAPYDETGNYTNLIKEANAQLYTLESTIDGKHFTPDKKAPLEYSRNIMEAYDLSNGLQDLKQLQNLEK